MTTYSDMTPHDRVLAVYQNKPIDRVAIGAYQRYLPRGSTERMVRNQGLTILDYYPVISLIGPPWHVYPGYLSQIQGAEFSITHCMDRGLWVERRCFRTPVGTVTQEIAHDNGGVGSENIRKHYITCKEDYRVVKYLVDHTVLHRNEKTIRYMMDNLGSDGILLGRIDRSPYQKCLIELVGPEKFLLDLYVDPEPALELMDAIDRKLNESFPLALESQVEVIWQPDNVTSDMTPPEAYRKCNLPFYSKHAKQVRQAAKLYVVHIDGRTRSLKELISQSGFDVIESLSLPEIGGDMTLMEARKAFAGMVIVPNIPANWCVKNDRELKQSMLELLAEVGSKVPFMLQLSEDIPAAEWQRVLSIICRVILEEKQAVNCNPIKKPESLASID